eukprot:SAG31_NODE_9391_length_1282_cov_1.196459_1_plen_248_part_00
MFSEFNDTACTTPAGGADVTSSTLWLYAPIGGVSMDTCHVFGQLSYTIGCDGGDVQRSVYDNADCSGDPGNGELDPAMSVECACAEEWQLEVELAPCASGVYIKSTCTDNADTTSMEGFYEDAACTTPSADPASNTEGWWMPTTGDRVDMSTDPDGGCNSWVWPGRGDVSYSLTCGADGRAMSTWWYGTECGADSEMIFTRYEDVCQCFWAPAAPAPAPVSNSSPRAKLDIFTTIPLAFSVLYAIVS